MAYKQLPTEYFTPNRVLVSDSTGGATASTLTSTEFTTVSYWTKYSFTHINLQAAALTNDIEILSLPAKGVIQNVIMKTTTAFAGTTSYTLSVGYTGSLLAYIGVQNAQAAVSATNFFVPAATFTPSPRNFSTAVSIRLSAISTVDNLDQSTAGAVDIYILTSILP